MEQKTQEQLSMNLPPYSLFSKPLDPRRKWLVAIVTGLILAVTIAVIVTLTIYMNQKNAEKMVAMSYTSGAGENVHQTFYSHDGGNVFAIFIKSDKHSASVLLDYNQKLIGIRTENRCYMLRMDESTTPSKPDLQRTIEHYGASNSTVGDSMTLSFISAEEVKLVDLGFNIKLMCGNVATYWAEMVKMKRKLALEDETTVIIYPDGTIVIVIIRPAEPSQSVE
ncbi:gastrokine-2-like [Phyllobates terribilis]|uniref:gastrokine-2-like n=1 Tax=Phyllobates terribilis TaxID=111132 RepID=UPI003CCB4FD8